MAHNGPHKGFALHFEFTAQINGSPDTIFDLLADMPNYGRWLPGSSAYGGTVNVTPYPVRLGTTYLDAGPVEKPGEVTEFARPHRIGFHHVVQIRRPFATDVDARVRYTLEPKDGGTFVTRDLDLGMDLRGLLMLARPLLVVAFRRENSRTLACLKAFVERASAVTDRGRA